MTLTKDTTIEALQKHLRDAHARIGFDGRFSFTIDQSAPLTPGRTQGGCYISHWFRPTPYAYETCRAVSSGSIAQCIDGLDRYVSGYHRNETQEELARTLGLPEKPVDRRATVDGYGDLTVQARQFRELAGEDMEPYFREGWEAQVGDLGVSYCPYDGDGDRRHAWRQGWLAAARHISP
jgi:hypothetical protein